MNRRDFLTMTGGAIAVVSLPLPADAAPKRRFRFVHATDLHIQPELGAAEGVRAAVAKILSLVPRPDFVITGGDHVMDLLAVDRTRADIQFALLAEALKPLAMPIYTTIGNHDVYGWSKNDAATKADAGYGKNMFAERISKGPVYHSWEMGVWKFIVLDSIQHEPKAGWRAEIDDMQLTWFKNELERTGKTRPIVIVSHVPIMTLFTQYATSTTAPTPDTMIVRNGKEVRDLFVPYNVKAVLQGHTHVVEDCFYAGTHFITSGAICGDWWKGPRLGVHPEGFAVYDVDGDKFRWEYVPYGWKARAS